MSCHSLRDAIVELARREAAGSGTLAAIECHLDHCASCAALLARERQLSAGLRALAATAAADAPSDDLERRLLESFAERRGAQPAAPAGASNWWARAAAVILVAGAMGSWWWSTGNEAGPAPTPSTTVAEAHAPELTRPPVTAPVASADGGHVTPVTGKTARGPRPAARRPNFVRATGFTAIPGADGLPDFESGEIIRMEIPLTSLPTYGLQIQPDSQGAPVEADLLVGQDGQARAIRLVTAGR